MLKCQHRSAVNLYHPLYMHHDIYTSDVSKSATRFGT